MNTNNHIAECLNHVKAALQRGDASSVAEALGKVDLDDLLSPDTIDDVRARREHVVCIFLFTLAVDRGAFPARAATWLACCTYLLPVGCGRWSQFFQYVPLARHFGFSLSQNVGWHQ